MNVEYDKGFVKINELIPNVLKEIKSNVKVKNDIKGIKTGFKNLDNITIGLRKKELTLLRGRPGSGKSSFALQLAYNMCLNNKSVAFFTAENSNVNIVKRIICSVAEVSYYNMEFGEISDEEMTKILNTSSKISNEKFFINENGKLTVSKIINQCRKIKETYGLDILFIDYLQLMYVDPCYDVIQNKKFSCLYTREEEIDLIKRRLKSFAKEIDISILLLSQLARKYEQNNPHKDINSFDSQASFDVSDMELLIRLGKNNGDDNNLFNALVVKNKNGRIGEALFLFDKSKHIFKEIN